MKKILMALIIAALANSGAGAQEKTKVCKRSPSKEVSCYETKYAENFKVCKDNNGYHICGEIPTPTNSTNYSQPTMPQEADYTALGQYPMSAPQSQSYPFVERQAPEMDVNNAASYEGYYPSKMMQRSCYVGDSVAPLSRAPYKGCNTPQSDGAEKNRQRNLNVNNNVE